MFKMEMVKTLAKKGIEKAKEKSPALLTGAVLVGVITTGYSAYKAGLAAHDILEKHKKDMADVEEGDTEAKKVVIKETVKEMAPVIAPVLISGGITMACAIGSNRISNARLAVMTAAYDISSKSLTDLNSKMKEKLGEKKTREIKDEIVKDKLQSSTASYNDVMVLGPGKVPCYDIYGDRYFPSSAQEITAAIHELSGLVKNEMFVELNEFYDLLHLDSKPYGRNVGFYADDLIGRDETIPIALSAQLREDGTPVLCVDYEDYLHPDTKYRGW